LVFWEVFVFLTTMGTGLFLSFGISIILLRQYCQQGRSSIGND